MGQKCNDGSCEPKDGSCDTKGNCGPEDCGTGCSMTDMILRISEEAWTELMKEKMKKALEAQIGEKMDKTAAAGVAASIAKWQHKMEGMGKCKEHTQKIQQSFMG